MALDGIPTRIILTGLRSAFIGPDLTFDAYRTAVATIVVGIDADIALTTYGAQQETSRDPITVIPPGTLCRLETRGSIAVLFCDALSDDFAQIDLDDLIEDQVALRELLSRGPQHMTPTEFLDRVFRLLQVSSECTARPEIARVVTAMNNEPEKFASIESAADLAGLSVMHFQHVFSDAVGMPFRRYRQWRRMGRVIRNLAAGASLTDAAYAAGFANSAHLSTAFKSMFGLRPSDLIKQDAEYYLSG